MADARFLPPSDFSRNRVGAFGKWPHLKRREVPDHSGDLPERVAVEVQRLQGLQAAEALGQGLEAFSSLATAAAVEQSVDKKSSMKGQMHTVCRSLRW